MYLIEPNKHYEQLQISIRNFFKIRYNNTAYTISMIKSDFPNIRGHSPDLLLIARMNIYDLIYMHFINEMNSKKYRKLENKKLQKEYISMYNLQNYIFT